MAAEINKKKCLIIIDLNFDITITIHIFIINIRNIPNRLEDLVRD